MKKIYVSVDGPTVELKDGDFREGLEFVAQATYGRVLFTQHGAAVANCSFILPPGEQCGIYIPSEMRGITVQRCVVQMLPK